MVLIKKDYKGFRLSYEKETFYAKKGKKKIYSSNSEKGLKEQIDSEITAKELESTKKILDKAKINVVADEFKDFIVFTSSFTSEACLKFKKNVLSITSMDPANVAMIHREIPFKGNTKFNFRVGVNLSELGSLLKKITKMHKTNKYSLQISFKATSDKYYDMVINNGFGEFTFPCVDIQEKEDRAPSLKFGAERELNAGTFKNLVELAHAVGESVKFTARSRRFELFAEGESSSYFKTLKGCTHKKTVSSKYSLEYLKQDFFKREALLEIKFGEDYPLRIDDDSGNWIILAPRVEN